MIACKVNHILLFSPANWTRKQFAATTGSKPEGGTETVVSKKPVLYPSL